MRALPFLSLLAACALAGCTFPTVNLGSEDAGLDASIDTGAQDSGADSTADSTVDSDLDTGSDTGAVDSDVDTAPIDSGDPCDKDGDGFKVATCVPAPPAGQADCDDSSGKVHPGVADFVYDDPSKEPGPWSLVGDWDCSGTVVKKYTSVSFSCSGLSLGGCGATGFDGTGTCGQSGHYLTCTSGGLGCVNASSTDAIQGCK